jgi:hypothetical protein
VTSFNGHASSIVSPPLAALMDSTIKFTACDLEGMPVAHQLPRPGAPHSDSRTFRTNISGSAAHPTVGIVYEAGGRYSIQLRPASPGDFQLRLELVDPSTGEATPVSNHAACCHFLLPRPPGHSQRLTSCVQVGETLVLTATWPCQAGSRPNPGNLGDSRCRPCDGVRWAFVGDTTCWRYRTAS